MPVCKIDLFVDFKNKWVERLSVRMMIVMAEGRGQKREKRLNDWIQGAQKMYIAKYISTLCNAVS